MLTVLDLLTAKETPGQHAPSFCPAIANRRTSFPALQVTLARDVCIVGEGYTGLWAALNLARSGMNVVLLEANRIGWRASGRNGGQADSGQRFDAFEKLNIPAFPGGDKLRFPLLVLAMTWFSLRDRLGI
ncbi:FAD-binding oxidoreductase [Roseibium sp. SCP14]|uniref:FAD-binding oxidoreductase n=1 Tax=Roseibium sp. SCP14 TaxID=3141375 RepID=UPI00333C7986